MGWYDGRGYYGRRHGGGFFLFPLIFIGMMLLFFTRGFFFFFMPLLVLGLFAFGAFMLVRFLFSGAHDYDDHSGWGWDDAEKRKNAPRFFTDQNGQRWQAVEDEKNKRYPNDSDFV
ncbi:MAG TPA: hypothetical protein VHD90_00290 [Phototrophicaceae bacterium]|nr:hypothetical protein [Phototrophicaceae bacterium]